MHKPPLMIARTLRFPRFILQLGLLAVVMVLGGFVYTGYKVRKNVERATSAPRASAAHREIKGVQTCPVVDPLQSAAFRDAAASALIPLKTGLTLVNVDSHPDGDVETFHTIQSVDQNSLTLQSGASDDHVSVRRTVCIADLMNARQVATGFATANEPWGFQHSWPPVLLSGATMLSVSQAGFQDWKAGRSARFGFVQVDFRVARPDYMTLWFDNEGTLERLEPHEVPVSVIVNGERKDLPAFHVKGQLKGRRIVMDCEAHVLEDPANPLLLTFEWIKGFRFGVVKINFPTKKRIEKDLEIADALRNNPQWKINIGGHTDNVGGDAYNVDLSQRRADAVQQAFVAQFQISPDRVSAKGYGASQPKASNDTVEGRALNRRVELVRE